MYAHTQTVHSKDHGRSIVQLTLPTSASQTCLYVNFALGNGSRALAHMLDSLVRVSRRVDEKHFVRVLPSHDRLTGQNCTHVFSRMKNEAWPTRCRDYNAHHCFPSVPFQQFQVLFHSLFKVLFIFPSRYLFAIGLPPIFSFRRNLPPD